MQFPLDISVQSRCHGGLWSLALTVDQLHIQGQSAYECMSGVHYIGVVIPLLAVIMCAVLYRRKHFDDVSTSDSIE